MRKIGSEHEIERKKKRNVLVISLFILFVLVLGTIGYGFLSAPSTPSTNSQQTNSANTYTINSQQIFFTYSKEEVSSIPVDITASLFSFSGKPLYLASENQALNFEIASTLGRFSSRAQEVCYGTCEKDLPEKDCSENLIVWTDSLENNVYQQENCIFIEGDLKAADAFLYKIFDI